MNRNHGNANGPTLAEVAVAMKRLPLGGAVHP